MNTNFDPEEARKHLIRKEENEKADREKQRVELFEKVVNILSQRFRDSSIEVYLVGSIIKPYMFHSHSDIDIVVKNFRGDRFDLWTELEGLFERNVEIILFEKCHFQEFVEKEGYKVI